MAGASIAFHKIALILYSKGGTVLGGMKNIVPVTKQDMGRCRRGRSRTTSTGSAAILQHEVTLTAVANIAGQVGGSGHKPWLGNPHAMLFHDDEAHRKRVSHPTNPISFPYSSPPTFASGLRLLVPNP